MIALVRESQEVSFWKRWIRAGTANALKAIN